MTDINRLRRMCEAGATVPDVLAAFPTRTLAGMRRLADAHGFRIPSIPPSGRKDFAPESVRRTCYELRREGLTWAVIARRIGRSSRMCRHFARYYAEKNGLKAPKPHKWHPTKAQMALMRVTFEDARVGREAAFRARPPTHVETQSGIA